MDIDRTQMQKISTVAKTMEVECMRVEPQILIKKITTIIIFTTNKMVVIIVPNPKHNMKMTQGTYP